MLQVLLFVPLWLLTSAFTRGPETSQVQQRKTAVPNATSKLVRLQQSFLKDRWVAYTPTELDPRPANLKVATARGIEEDLRVLRPFFDVLITYSTNEEQRMDLVVPSAAKSGMRVCLGVWDVKSVREIARAVALAKQYPETVIAIIVGNETQLFHRAEWEDLEAAIRLVKLAVPSVPVSTSEPIDAYGNEDLRRIVDFHSPIAFYIHHSSDRTNVDAAVAWLKERIKALRSLSDKPILIKEHGFPSGPTPFTAALQAKYWTACQAAIHPSGTYTIAFFEAFCAPWKSVTNAGADPVLTASEALLGAWDENRQPLKVVATFKRKESR